ncbi:MAG: hypothetical protein GYB27_23970 [Rhodobacteraceae bacterium]|nr:hypothetical protein [Paracoccaceae bacterium]
MIDPKLAEDVATYGKSMGNAVETILDVMTDTPAWSDRLRFFFNECTRAPVRAFRRRMLTTAVLDLVSLDAACHAYSLADGSLHATDRGGALVAKKARAELLILVARHDATLARDLAIDARLRSEEYTKRLQELFTNRA